MDVTEEIFWQANSATSNAFWWSNSIVASMPAAGGTISHSNGMDIGVDSIEEAGRIVAPYNARLIGIAYNLHQDTKHTSATYFKIVAMRQEVTDGTARTADATWENIGEIQSNDRSGSTDPVVIKKSVILNSSNGDVNAGDIILLAATGFGSAGAASETQGFLRGTVTLMFDLR